MSENESFVMLIALIYSIITAIIGWTAEYANDVQLMNIQIAISKIYYVLSTIDHLYRFKYVCYEDAVEKRLKVLNHKILFLLHHIITTWLLFYMHLYISSDMHDVCLNRMFTIFITSNILLYYVSYKCKYNWQSSISKIIIITIETMLYVIFRLVLPLFYIANYLQFMNIILIVPMMVLYIAGIWWSYGMIVKMITTYDEYFKKIN